jgi:hypothetical protein
LLLVVVIGARCRSLFALSVSIDCILCGCACRRLFGGLYVGYVLESQQLLDREGADEAMLQPQTVARIG